MGSDGVQTTNLGQTAPRPHQVARTIFDFASYSSNCPISVVSEEDCKEKFSAFRNGKILLSVFCPVQTFLDNEERKSC